MDMNKPTGRARGSLQAAQANYGARDLQRIAIALK
jgi:hypothetical protein